MSFRNIGGTHNFGAELQRAINERNCDEVKILLSNGANINQTVNSHLDTMLHTVKNVAVLRDLLGFSANVNVKNVCDQTPLHAAVIACKSTEVVKILLDHGAHVDARDANGCTPLNLAVKSMDPNWDVIKTLIMHGADVNAKCCNIALYEHWCSPLAFAAVFLSDLTCAQVLIKYTLVTRQTTLRQEDYGDVIDLDPYYRHPKFGTLKKYFQDCVDEIGRMKNERMTEKHTLHFLVATTYDFREALCNDEPSSKLFTERVVSVLSSGRYPIYCDLIAEKLRNKLTKSCLVPKLDFIQVCAVSDSQQREIHLNSYTKRILSKYLTRDDLFHFILASFENCNKFSNFSPSGKIVSADILKRPLETATCTPCAKHKKGF